MSLCLTGLVSLGKGFQLLQLVLIELSLWERKASHLQPPLSPLLGSLYPFHSLDVCGKQPLPLPSWLSGDELRRMWLCPTPGLGSEAHSSFLDIMLSGTRNRLSSLCRVYWGPCQNGRARFCFPEPTSSNMGPPVLLAHTYKQWGEEHLFPKQFLYSQVYMSGNMREHMHAHTHICTHVCTRTSAHICAHTHAYQTSKYLKSPSCTCPTPSLAIQPVLDP